MVSQWLVSRTYHPRCMSPLRSRSCPLSDPGHVPSQIPVMTDMYTDYEALNIVFDYVVPGVILLAALAGHGFLGKMYRSVAGHGKMYRADWYEPTHEEKGPTDELLTSESSSSGSISKIN